MGDVTPEQWRQLCVSPGAEPYRIACEQVQTKEDALAFLHGWLDECEARWPEKTRLEHRAIQLSNIGYWSFYYADPLRILDLFETEHPYFGRTIPTPEEAFELGQQLARKTDDA